MRFLFSPCRTRSECTQIPGITRLLTYPQQPNGAEKAINPLEGINEREQALLTKALEDLKGNITKGINFAHNPPQK